MCVLSFKLLAVCTLSSSTELQTMLNVACVRLTHVERFG